MSRMNTTVLSHTHIHMQNVYSVLEMRKTLENIFSSLVFTGDYM